MPSTALGVLFTRGDPAYSWKWVYADETLPFGLPYSFVEGCDLAFDNIAASSPIFANSGFTAIASSHTLGGVSLTLYEDQNGTSLKWIQTWKKTIKDFRSGNFNGTSAYKRDLKFQLLNNYGLPVVTARYSGCFPTETGNLSLNYTDSGRITLTQQFWADNVEIS